jgi:putative ABC transport system permease protein
MPSPIPAPPRLPAWLLDRILPQGVRGASIKGDLLEEMAVRARATSIGRARLWYWAQAIAIAVQAAIPRRDYHYEPTDRKASTMESVLADLKFAVRSLSKARGFTVTAVLTLALGIGASTAVFSVANAVLLRPLPFANPDRLMWISEVRKSGTPMSVAWPDYLDWREQSKSFEALAAIQRGIVNFTGTGEPERLDARFVTSGFFDILGVRPALGRTFRPDEDRLGAAPVVLISDALWRRRFDADPNVTGRTMTLGGVPNEIIGVMPAGFRYNLQTDDDVIGSLGQRATPESGLPDRGNHNGVSVIGRLRPGIDENAARRDLDRVAATLRQAYPNTNADTYAQIQSLEQRLVGPIATRIWVLFGAVALLLMLAVVNVANLMVARGLSRRHELSVRAALGGGRWRLVRQLLVESSLLASIGGAAGIVTSAGLIKLFVLTAPEDIPRLADIGMSPAVWLFAFALSAVAALVLGVVPAIQSSAIRGQQALIRAGRGDTAPASAHRLRRGLMTLEVALAIVLLTGAGLMTRTMYAVSTVDPGFDAGGVLTMRYSIAGARSTGAEQTAFNRRVANFGDEVLRTVRALPGVENAALALSLPIEGSQWNSVFIVSDQPVPARANLPISAFSPVSAGYFETLRMRVQSGRVFDGRDGVDAPRTVIVNESFARRFWPGGDAVGKRLKQGWPEGDAPWREIVGVVNDVKVNGVEVPTPLQVYLPYSQEAVPYAALIVRASGAPEPLAPAIRNAVNQLDANLPVFAVQTMNDLMRDAVTQRSMTMVVFGGFAVVALVMACVGLFGVVSQGVTERTREVGVRLALGATGGQVVRHFVGQGVTMAAIGVAVGIGAGLALSGFAQDLLFNVEPTDPLTFAVSAVTLTAISAAACYIPARRASRVSPTITLRGE